MKTETVRKTWGARGGVTLDLLARFTRAGDPQFGEIRSVWNYRGIVTATEERRVRSSMPREAWEHHQWDTVACNGGVVVCVPHWKSSDERGGSFGVPAHYWWAMAAVAEEEPEERLGVRAADPLEIASIPKETRELLAELPGLEHMSIKRVGFFSTGRRRRQFRDAPQGVRFFRLAAGYGCAAIPAE